jgi:hypothetical protein
MGYELSYINGCGARPCDPLGESWLKLFSIKFISELNACINIVVKISFAGEWFFEELDSICCII